MQHPCPGGEAVAFLLRPGECAQSAFEHLDSLGFARRTGGVDDVGHVTSARCGLRQAAVAVRIGQIEHGGSRTGPFQSLDSPASGQHHPHVAVLDQPAQARGGMGGVQRHQHRLRPGHREQGDDRVGGARHAHPDPVARHHAPCPQPRGHPGAATVELAIGEAAVRRLDREGILTGDAQRVDEQGLQAGRCGVDLRGRPPGPQQRRLPGGVAAQLVHAQRRIGDDAPREQDVSVQDRRRGLVVEQVT